MRDSRCLVDIDYKSFQNLVRSHDNHGGVFHHFQTRQTHCYMRFHVRHRIFSSHSASNVKHAMEFFSSNKPQTILFIMLLVSRKQSFKNTSESARVKSTKHGAIFPILMNVCQFIRFLHFSPFLPTLNNVNVR